MSFHRLAIARLVQYPLEIINIYFDMSPELPNYCEAMIHLGQIAEPPSLSTEQLAPIKSTWGEPSLLFPWMV